MVVVVEGVEVVVVREPAADVELVGDAAADPSAAPPHPARAHEATAIAMVMIPLMMRIPGTYTRARTSGRRRHRVRPARTRSQRTSGG